MNEVEYFVCPFCKEDDFDLIGLKGHFLNGYCKEFNVIEIRTSLFGQQFLLSECERLELRVKELEKEHKGMVRLTEDEMKRLGWSYT